MASNQNSQLQHQCEQYNFIACNKRLPRFKSRTSFKNYSHISMLYITNAHLKWYTRLYVVLYDTNVVCVAYIRNRIEYRHFVWTLNLFFYTQIAVFNNGTKRSSIFFSVNTIILHSFPYVNLSLNGITDSFFLAKQFFY